MKELLDFQQTKDLLYSIQRYDRQFDKWSPVELCMEEFIFYTLIKHNPDKPEISYEMIVNKIVFELNKYQRKDIAHLNQAVLKDLIYYYENNNNKIKVDEFNIDIMQMFSDQSYSNKEIITYFLDHSEYKHINQFFQDSRLGITWTSNLQECNEMIEKFNKELESEQLRRLEICEVVLQEKRKHHKAFSKSDIIILFIGLFLFFSVCWFFLRVIQ